jgi:L,D-transpeptidase catalytic domain
MYCVAISAMGWIPRRLIIAAAAITVLLGGLSSAQATVVITVNKSTQRLSVSVDGDQRYVWRVSTARRGYATPNGSYRPERLERKWYSRKYDWSPMPYSIFFDGGYAIHGSYEVSHLGRPASHGCVRLHPKHAAVLFSLVRKNRSKTRIIVTGERPSRRVSTRAQHKTHSSRKPRTKRVHSASFGNIFE